MVELNFNVSKKFLNNCLFIYIIIAIIIIIFIYKKAIIKYLRSYEKYEN